MSYSAARVRTPWRRPGWLVTSLTRSPCMWSSGGRSRSPAMYAAPVLAGMLGLLLDRTGAPRTRCAPAGAVPLAILLLPPGHGQENGLPTNKKPEYQAMRDE